MWRVGIEERRAEGPFECDSGALWLRRRESVQCLLFLKAKGEKKEKRQKGKKVKKNTQTHTHKRACKERDEEREEGVWRERERDRERAQLPTTPTADGPRESGVGREVQSRAEQRVLCAACSI